MLEELLRRSLELEQSRSFVFGPRGGASMNIECGHLDHRARFNVVELPASHHILPPAIGSRSKWKAGAIGHERTATAEIVARTLLLMVIGSAPVTCRQAKQKVSIGCGASGTDLGETASLAAVDNETDGNRRVGRWLNWGIAE
jgi:hypothetical protein